MATHRVHLLRALRRHRGERGQAIVEFAMVLPFIAALVLIFVSFGKALYYYIELTHVANEGARQAAVDRPNSGTQTLTQYLCQQFGTSSELFKGSGTVTPAAVTISYPDTSSSTPQAVGEPVKVNVSTRYKWFPFMNLGSFTITGSATMRIEDDTSANSLLSSGTCS
jgi:Flp pilus assembly protein TadG